MSLILSISELTAIFLCNTHISSNLLRSACKLSSHVADESGKGCHLE